MVELLGVWSRSIAGAAQMRTEASACTPDEWGWLQGEEGAVGIAEVMRGKCTQSGLVCVKEQGPGTLRKSVWA